MLAFIGGVIAVIILCNLHPFISIPVSLLLALFWTPWFWILFIILAVQWGFAFFMHSWK